MINRQLLDACDVVYRIRKSGNEANPWYVLGYVGSTQTSDRRNVTRRGEIGSNATFLLVDEAQKSMTMQRLNVARSGGEVPFNMNLPAMIKYILSDQSSTEKIIIDIDDASFNLPFDMIKEYYTVARETGGTLTNGVYEPVAKTLYERCRIVQTGLAIGAASKYTDDVIALIWERTTNEDLGGASAAAE